MKKQFMNIKDFVHINLTRGERSEVLNEDLVNAEKRVDLIKQTCANTEKKILLCLQTAGNAVDSLSVEKRLKKMPQTQLSQSFTELAEQLGTDSVLGLTLSECSKLQNLSAKELLSYEMDVEKQCLNALTKVMEVEIPVVNKAKKQLNKATTDMDNYRVKYQTALKLSQQNTGSALSSAQKAESLRRELEESTVKVDQQRDIFAAEMFALLSNESDYAHIFLDYFRAQANYHKKMQDIMQVYLPLIERVISDNSQKPVFGTSLEEHLRVTKREISVVLETCIGWLLNCLNEEGLFRIPGSTSKVRKLKNAFDAGVVDADEYYRDTHTIAGTLKSYLRELPEPLLTYGLYNEWISAAKVNDIDSRLQAMWQVCNKMPKAHLDNLRYLVKFLSKLANNSDSNKMSSQNLAIAIAPSLMWPQTDGQPFDMNMTAANHHSLIMDALINYCDWFFPGDISFVTFSAKEDKISNGDNTYSGDHYSNRSQIPRSAKKPAPPVPKNTRPSPLERSDSMNGTKYSSDSSEESSAVREFTPTSLESDCRISLGENIDPNSSTSTSSVIYTASLDRPVRRATDGHSDRPVVNDRKTTNIQLRNKAIEKPNVPPPSVPIRNSSERPTSVHERPSLPPPERPQRSCDNKVKPRSLEVLNDSDSGEEKIDESHSTSKSLYPSLNDLIDSPEVKDSLIDLESNDSNDNNPSLDLSSLKRKAINANDCIAFADDSDIEDNNNVSAMPKIDASYVQRLKQGLPSQTIPSKPPRPLPPNKPRIASSTEDTHL